MQGKAVPHLLGDPTLPPEQEYALRERLTEKALTTLSMDVTEPVLFTVA